MTTLTLVPGGQASPADQGPRSRVDRHQDEHGEFFVATCTCTWASAEYADPERAEAARAVHDDAHLPPGHPDQRWLTGVAPLVSQGIDLDGAVDEDDLPQCDECGIAHEAVSVRRIGGFQPWLCPGCADNYPHDDDEDLLDVGELDDLDGVDDRPGAP